MIGLFALFVGAVLVLAISATILMPGLPSVQSLSDEPLKVPMRVYSTESQLLAEFGEEKRIP
ncbi:MAG: hypothetical protein V3V96_01360, partial [Acidiferrobacterales bacterium]